MRNLNTYLESLLDADFDVNVTIGDKYVVLLHFSNKAPSDFNGRDWKHEQFWTNYDMNNYPRLAKVVPARLKFLKSDVRHGLVAYILAQPLCKIDKQFINNCTKAINKLCDRKNLIIDADLRGGKSDSYEINLYNTKNATAASIGYFELIPKTYHESLLSTDFDVEVKKIIDAVPKCKAALYMVDPYTKRFIKETIKLPKLPKDRLTWNQNGGGSDEINVWLCEQPMSWVDAEDSDAFMSKFQEVLTPYGKKQKWQFKVEAAYPDSYGTVQLCYKEGRKWIVAAWVQLFMK